MRLKSLSVKNYRQYKESTIEFGDGITGIVGLNGAGKSTLVEAIAWTLYGPNAARTGKEGIKRSTAPMGASVETELVLEIAGTEYKIVRVLKGSSQSADASMISGGKVIADSVKGVEKEVTYLLGMDWKSFYTSFFARQKELNALTELTPATRRDVIIRMLRIDAIDKVVDSVKKQLKEKKLALELLNKQVVLRKPTEILAEKLAIEKTKKETEKELRIVEGEITKIEAVRSRFKERFNEERAIYNKFTALDKKRASLDARLTGLAKRESELNEELSQVRKLEKESVSLEKAHNEYIELEKKLKKLSIAKESEIRSIESKMEDLRGKYAELSENKKKLKAGAPCPTCGQLIKDRNYIEQHFDEEMNRIKAEGVALKTRLEALKSDKKIEGDMNKEMKEYAEISKRLEELEPSHRKYPMVKAKVEKRSDIETALARVVAERSDLESELKAAIKEMKEVPYDEKKHGTITEELDEVETSLKKKYEMRNEIRLEIERMAQKIKDMEKEIEDSERTGKDIDKITRDQEKQERFVNLVTEYRQFLISRIRPKLAEISGMLLSELTAGKYTGVELDEEYNLFIYDGNMKYPLARFSGGEADIANLCLRLSISQLIAESSGTETGFIILDEIFGSQDLHRKSAIIEALNRLSKQFRQIILITHVEDIKDTVENIIEVAENEEGISSIKA